MSDLFFGQTRTQCSFDHSWDDSLVAGRVAAGTASSSPGLPHRRSGTDGRCPPLEAGPHPSRVCTAEIRAVKPPTSGCAGGGVRSLVSAEQLRPESVTALRLSGERGGTAVGAGFHCVWRAIQQPRSSRRQCRADCRLSNANGCEAPLLCGTPPRNRVARLLVDRVRNSTAMQSSVSNACVISGS